MENIQTLKNEILNNEDIVIKMQGLFIIKALEKGITEQKLNSWFNKLDKLYNESSYPYNKNVIAFLEEIKTKITKFELVQF